MLAKCMALANEFVEGLVLADHLLRRYLLFIYPRRQQKLVLWLQLQGCSKLTIIAILFTDDDRMERLS